MRVTSASGGTSPTASSIWGARWSVASAELIFRPMSASTIALRAAYELRLIAVLLRACHIVRPANAAVVASDSASGRLSQLCGTVTFRWPMHTRHCSGW